MPEKPSIYNKWVRDWMKLPLLIIALFPHLMLMTFFHSNSTFTASILDVDADDLQFILSLMYGSIVVILLINNRFFSFFPVRTFILLVVGISVGILLLISQNNHYGFVIPLRILEGIFGLLEGAIFLPIIISEIKSKHAKTLAYFILYTIMMTGGTFTTSVLKESIVNFGWTEMVYIITGFHVVVLIITLFLFNKNRFFPKMHLYQVDWVSCILLLVCLHSGAFAIIYGRKYYWFESDLIVLTICISVLFAGLFLYRQMHLKRRIFHFEIIKFKQVKIAMLLFFFYYIVKSGINNIYSVMLISWNWPWEFVVDVQYFHVIGVFIGVATSGYLLLKAYSNKLIFALGFLLFTISFFWISRVFTSDVTVMAIGSPLFLSGIAQGWLFTPLAMYLINGLPTHLVGNGAVLGTATRFWATNIGFAFTQNILYNFIQKNYNVLQSHLDLSIPNVSEKYDKLFQNFGLSNEDSLAQKLTIKSLHNEIYNQAFLLANSQIFQMYMCIALVTFLIILITVPNRNNIKSFIMRFGIYK